MGAMAFSPRGTSWLDVGTGWCATRAVLLLLVALRIVVAPLAEASPADPTWIPGIYDDGDFDDIVDQLDSLTSACDWAPAPTPTPSSCGPVPPASSRPVPGA